MRHKFLSVFVAALVAVTMASDAWAKAGKGSSMGSRGSRTYDRPIERSTTPPPAQTAPSQAAPAPAGQPMYNPGAVRQPGMAAAPMAAQPSFLQRNPMMAGMLGGLVGVGIGSMLFGNSPALAAASDAAPGASAFGMFLQIALIGGLGYLAYRMFRRRQQPAAPVGAAAYQRQAETTYGGASAAPRRAEKEFELSPEDQDTFTQIIAGVQKAWSDGNPIALRALVTPEVMGWMSEDLARDQSNGVRNVMEDVSLLKGDVTETWRDEKMEYATALIVFSAKDYMVSLADGRVVEGDAQNPVETQEAWTFARSPGGRWMLSAIEQV